MKHALQKGDYIVHELEPEASKITSMEHVQPGEKYGSDISSVPFEDFSQSIHNYYIFDVEDGHWVRSEQVDFEATKTALWLQHEAPLEVLPEYINDSRFRPILRERLNSPLEEAAEEERSMKLGVIYD